MSKKNDQKKELKKAFNSVMKAFEKEPDKRLRKQVAASLQAEFEKVTLKLKGKSGQSHEQSVIPGNNENGSSKITPSPAVLDGMREAVFAS